MILQIIQQILGIILFLLPGIFLSYIIFSKTDIIKRAVYSVVLAVSISTILGVFLYLLNLLTLINTILFLIFLNLLFLLILILNSKNKQYKTDFNKTPHQTSTAPRANKWNLRSLWCEGKDIWYLIFFSLFGTIWRILFLKSIKNFSDVYGYAFKFVGKSIPDLGFYTGMAVDHSRFIGISIFSKIFDFLSINNLYIELFLITFIFLGFVYLVFSEYRNKKIAYIGVALMALGPIEIFHSTLSIMGHPLSYIALFSLFLLFKSENKKIFWIALLLTIAMIFTYYTASMVILLTSIGFMIALFIKDFLKTKNIKKSAIDSFRNKKIIYFLLIAIVSLTFIFGFSSFEKNNSSNIELITKHITTYSIMKYQEPAFLGLSAIRWQMLFFFLSGLTFIFYIIKKREFSEKNIDLLLCLIPILFVSYAFFYANLPTRIFNYFAFFGLLVVKIPKKYLKIFFILSFIFMLTTSFYLAKDKKIFFETSDKEIEGAVWIKNSLSGKIFSDQFFINQLVSNEYYNVTGTSDDDPLVYNLFYQDNSSVFLDAINTLNINLKADYIVLTKRMQEQYILMLSMAQKPMTNVEFYGENLKRIYNNGDVEVYEIKNKNYEK